MQKLDKTSSIYLIIQSTSKVKGIVGNQTLELSLPGAVRWLRTQAITSTYVHFLSTSIAYILFKTGLDRGKLYWIMWGADFYRLPRVRANYFMPLSKEFMPPINSFRSHLSNLLSLPSYKHVENILPQIDYYVGYPEEYDHIQKELNLPMELIQWEFYFDVTEMERPVINHGSGKVLLGNSDDPTNNHLDVLELMSKRGMIDHHLIIPMAGAKPDYRLAVYDKAQDFKLELLEKLMDTASFFKKMEEVSYVVYGHLRQQGVGTILPLMYAGKKVFLWESNPLTTIFKRWGLQIFSLDDMRPEDFSPLTQIQAEEQRQALEQFISHEKGNEIWNEILRDRGQKKVDLD